MENGSTKRNSTYVVRTLGCKANLADSQRIEAELQTRGFRAWRSGNVEPARVCVINSCTVTDEADRQTRKLAARLSREHPGAAIVVTGCAAEVDPERLLNSKGIRYVVGNRDKPRLVDLILQHLQVPASAADPGGLDSSKDATGRILGRAEGYSEMASRHPMDRDWPEAADAVLAPAASLAQAGARGDSSKTRLFLKIQEGCNSFCTYCVIPYGRGPSRSLEPEQIVEWVREVAASGVREIVFTGTNIGDYGTDWAGEPRLELLLEKVLRDTSIERIRLSSLDPTEITDGIVSLMAREERICPHFHVSLQSASDRVLRLMKRRYGVNEIETCFERISRVRTRSPGGVFIGMDVIAGFPGETESEFEAGVELLKKLPWTRLHVFPYSEREGTPATRLPGSVPPGERQRRTRVLNQLSAERFSAWHEGIAESCCRSGEVLAGVLLERSGFRPPADARAGHSSGQQQNANVAWFAGYTPNYVRVAVQQGPGIQANKLISVRPDRLILDSTGGGEAVFLSEVIVVAGLT